MAIDTLEKRYASLTFGVAGRAGTREPTGSSSAFRRTAALGGYYQEPAVLVITDSPSSGWQFAKHDRVFLFRKPK